MRGHTKEYRHQLYPLYGIVDESPANVLCHVRLRLSRSMNALNDFDFTDARLFLEQAQALSGQLARDLAQVGEQ